MNLLFDTNILIDIFTERQPFFQDSYAAFHKALCRNDTIFISSCTVTDMMYILRKYFSSKAELKQAVYEFVSTLNIIDVTGEDLHNAFLSEMEDFEDAVQASCAAKVFADYIITRNIKDFASSPIPVIEPSDFLLECD